MVKKLLRALSGEANAVPPVWLMRQAGRYLPEYRALRAKAPNFIQFCLNPELAAEVTLQPVRRFGLDGTILFADILLIPHALGQSVAFVENEGPKLEPIRDAAAVAKLSDTHAAEILSPVMQTIKNVHGALPAGSTLIGFAGAPWTVATYMIEGHGGTDFENCRRMAWTEPKLFDALMDKLVSATSAYLIAQADAGAEALQIFDTWAGAVPAPLFERAVIVPTAKIVRAVKAKYPKLPIIGFPRASASHLAHYVKETGVDGIGIDQTTDLSWARDTLPARVTLQGNLDPMLLLAGGDAMAQQARAMLQAMRGRPYIFNLGHGVMQPTPPDHIARLVETVRAG